MLITSLFNHRLHEGKRGDGGEVEGARLEATIGKPLGDAYHSLESLGGGHLLAEAGGGNSIHSVPSITDRADHCAFRSILFDKGGADTAVASTHQLGGELADLGIIGILDNRVEVDVHFFIPFLSFYITSISNIPRFVKGHFSIFLSISFIGST